MADPIREKAENERLRAELDKVGKCPGCGQKIEGSHFCPGPERGSSSWSAEQEVKNV